MATEPQNLSFYIILRAYKAPYKALFWPFFCHFSAFFTLLPPEITYFHSSLAFRRKTALK